MSSVVHVRCGSCRRTVAVSGSETALRNTVYCSEWCMNEVPAVRESARNDVWKFLYQYGGRTPVTIGKMYGSGHSLVYRTLAKM